MRQINIPLTILLVLFAKNLVFSTNYYVNDTITTGDIFCSTKGSASNSATAKNSPKLTLSSVLTTFSLSFTSGDTIFVDTGTYSEIFLSSPQNGVVIKGAGIGSTNYTKFIKSGSDRYFMFIDDNNTILSNLIIEGYDNSLAAAGKGMAINISSGVTGVVLNNVNVRSIQSSVGGVSWPIRIESNTGVTFNGGGSSCNSTNGTTPGGGILITGTGSTVSINNYQFVNNYRNDVGANLCITSGNSTNLVTIKNSRFENGTSSGNKGVGIYTSSGTLKIYDCFFKGNTIQDGGGNFVGGTICAEGTSTLLVSRSTFSANTGTGSGGVYGVAIGINGASVNAQIDSCYFVSNSGSSGTHANDIEVKSGITLARYCVFASSNRVINQTGGTFTVSNCGNPSKGGSITMANTTISSYTANPSVPTYSGTCGTAITILPIELVKFEGDCFGSNIQLFWQTASEENNNMFTVEKSFNGTDFFTLGTINGAGTTQNFISYKFTDDTQMEEVQYYRLSQTDYDGKQSQSNIIAVNKNCKNELNDINIYPNPLTNQGYIELKLHKKQTVTVLIYDSTGRLVREEKPQTYESGYSNLIVDFSGLDSGVYLVKTVTDKEELTKRIVKL